MSAKDCWRKNLSSRIMKGHELIVHCMILLGAIIFLSSSLWGRMLRWKRLWRISAVLSSLSYPIVVTIDIMTRLVLELGRKDGSKWTAVTQVVSINSRNRSSNSSRCMVILFSVPSYCWRLKNSNSIPLLLRFRKTWICKMCIIQWISFVGHSFWLERLIALLLESNSWVLLIAQENSKALLVVIVARSHELYISCRIRAAGHSGALARRQSWYSTADGRSGLHSD